MYNIRNLAKEMLAFDLYFAVPRKCNLFVLFRYNFQTMLIFS